MRRLFHLDGLLDWSSESLEMKKYINPAFQSLSAHLQLSLISVFYFRVSGRKMEKFSVSVNIAANSNVTFTLTYEELLQRKQGHYEILTRVKPKTLVQEFQVHLCSWFYFYIMVIELILTESLSSQMMCVSVCVRGQIVTNIFEPQGITFVDAHATFLSNDLLPLVDKRVTDKKVRGTVALQNSKQFRFHFLCFTCTSISGPRIAKNKLSSLCLSLY